MVGPIVAAADDDGLVSAYADVADFTRHVTDSDAVATVVGPVSQGARGFADRSGRRPLRQRFTMSIIRQSHVDLPIAVTSGCLRYNTDNERPVKRISNRDKKSEADRRESGLKRAKASSKEVLQMRENMFACSKKHMSPGETRTC